MGDHLPLECPEPAESPEPVRAAAAGEWPDRSASSPVLCLTFRVLLFSLTICLGVGGGREGAVGRGIRMKLDWWAAYQVSVLNTK